MNPDNESKKSYLGAHEHCLRRVDRRRLRGERRGRQRPAAGAGRAEDRRRPLTKKSEHLKQIRAGAHAEHAQDQAGAGVELEMSCGAQTI